MYAVLGEQYEYTIFILIFRLFSDIQVIYYHVVV